MHFADRSTSRWAGQFINEGGWTVLVDDLYAALDEFTMRGI
jgi:hypothetical protein